MMLPAADRSRAGPRGSRHATSCQAIPGSEPARDDRRPSTAPATQFFNGLLVLEPRSSLGQQVHDYYDVPPYWE